MSQPNRRRVGQACALFLLIPLLGGCDALRIGDAQIDGHWKGQMVATDVQQRARPKRILMRLEEKDGAIRGEYARSSDAVAFRQAEADTESVRRVSLNKVSGSFDAPAVRLSFDGDSGCRFEVQATLGGNSITGTYVSRCATGGSKAGDSETGSFEIHGE